MRIGARADARGPTYRVLRELGARAQHSYAAMRESGEPHRATELVVVQRFARAQSDAARRAPEASVVSAEAMALLMRDARCLDKQWHPNLARVRHVDLVSGELFVATELIDGATLADLIAEQRVAGRDVRPVGVLARVLLDVLAGLTALAGLRDGMNAPLNAIHGELCPANVVVGRDGIARLVAVFRPRPVKIVAGSEAVGYAAPEALDGTGTDDPRADLYAAGVMLWEALSGGRLFDEIDPARVLARQRAEELRRPELPASSPLSGLADVAMRAIAFDPALRYRSASELASDLRRAAGASLASGAAVAEWVSRLAGDRIRTRRVDLVPGASGTRRRASWADLPGPRLSMSDGDVPAPWREAPRASVRPKAPTITPLTPNVPLDAPAVRTADGSSVPPRATADVAASPPPPPWPPIATPGELVVPIGEPKVASPARRAAPAMIVLVSIAAAIAIAIMTALDAAEPPASREVASPALEEPREEPPALVPTAVSPPPSTATSPEATAPAEAPDAAAAKPRPKIHAPARHRAPKRKPARPAKPAKPAFEPLAI